MTYTIDKNVPIAPAESGAPSYKGLDAVLQQMNVGDSLLIKHDPKTAKNSLATTIPLRAVKAWGKRAYVMRAEPNMDKAKAVRLWRKG